MLSRRHFLSSVCAVALCLASPANAWFPRGKAVPTFVGNPNVTITAIQATGAGTLGAITGGSGGTSGPYDNVALTGGTGTGATAAFIVNAAGAVAFVMLEKPGSGYAVNDVLSASSADIGNCTGFSIPVSSVGITCSRVSGQTPAFFMVSASGITATGTTNPYEDLSYSWDFGDPSGTEFFVNPTNGGQVNANVHQRGPDAAYCYRTAGTYTITLTATGKNGSGYTTKTVTQIVTVSAYNASGGEYYFDSNAVVDGIGTIGSPFNAWSHFATVSNANNVAIHFKRGSVFEGSAELSKHPFRMDAYGIGANPIIQLSSGAGTGGAILFMTNGHGSAGNPRDDIVISNIDVVRKVNANCIGFVYTTNDITCGITNLYLDNVNAVSDVAASGTAGYMIRMNFPNDVPLVTPNANWGIWGGSAAPTVANQALGSGLLGTGQHWSFIVGWSTSGPGTDAVFDHHIYPDTQNHQLYQWINFGAGSLKNYCVNTNFDQTVNDTGPGIYQDALYACFTENYFSGALRGHDFGNANNNPARTAFSYTVDQLNSYTGLGGNGVNWFACAKTATFRYNKVWACDGGAFYAPTGTVATFILRAYGNKVYRNALASASGDSAFFWLETQLWSNLHTITDNIIEDVGTVAQIANLNTFAGQAGAIIDRNQYWAPNDADAKYLYNANSAKAFGPSGTAGTWQNAGFDLNGFVADPNWPDPANGNFG